MSGRELVTRGSLKRELALNAATKPLSIVVGASVAVAALVLGVPWLLPVALVVYLALAVATFLDGDEAARVGEEAYRRAREVRAPSKQPAAELAPPIAVLVERARAEEGKVTRTIAEADLPLDDVALEVKELTAELERSARRAQVLWDYRSEGGSGDARERLDALKRESGGDADTVDARRKTAAALEDRIRIGDALSDDLDRFLVEMEHQIATLGVVHAQLVRMSVTDTGRVQGEVAEELRDLRKRMGALAEGMRSAVARVEDDQLSA